MTLSGDCVHGYKMEDNTDCAGAEDLTSTLAAASATYGKVNKGYNVTSSSTYLRGNDTTTFQWLHNGSDFSISIWVRQDTSTTSTSHAIMGSTRGGDVRGIIWNMVGRRVYFTIARSSPYPALAGSWIDSLPASTHDYFHLVITYDDSADEMKLYVNNVVNGTTASRTNACQVGTQDQYLTVGTNKVSGTLQPLLDYMDEAYFFTTVLTQANVNTLWNGGNGLTYPFLVTDTENAVFTSMNF